MINRVVLVGNLTKEPDLRYTQSGVAVATFTLAVGRPFGGQDGEKQTDFINCVVWKKAAENCANFLKKGSKAGVDGRIQTRNYEGSDGKRVYVTEVVAESVQFLDSKEQGEQRQAPPNQQQNRPPANRGFQNSGSINIQDDDLPF
jgi:single-strand DNA-binding protein